MGWKWLFARKQQTVSIDSLSQPTSHPLWLSTATAILQGKQAALNDELQFRLLHGIWQRQRYTSQTSRGRNEPTPVSGRKREVHLNRTRFGAYVERNTTIHHSRRNGIQNACPNSAPRRDLCTLDGEQTRVSYDRVRILKHDSHIAGI